MGGRAIVQQAALELVKSRYRQERYKLVEVHSAVKKCLWLHKSLTQGRACYKQKFYGIKSHRCLQMTPAAYYCTLRCLFCWRVQLGDIEENLQADELEMPTVDSPESIVEGCLTAQKQILSGYKGHTKVNTQMYAEAMNPNHVAISLTGEPTLYPRLSSLISEFRKRSMTSFLVTNGTLPKALEKLEQEPTQLYLSLYAPDEVTFIRMCRSHIAGAWQHIQESLELLGSFSCPTALRLTAVRGLNMEGHEGYAKLIEKSGSTYVEVKAYMYLGFSRMRLKFENMPKHDDVKAFARRLSELTGYHILDESADSRVVLLSRLKQTRKLVGAA